MSAGSVVNQGYTEGRSTPLLPQSKSSLCPVHQEKASYRRLHPGPINHVNKASLEAAQSDCTPYEGPILATQISWKLGVFDRKLGPGEVPPCISAILIYIRKKC